MDATLYQLVLNTDSIPDAPAAELVVQLATSTHASSSAGTPRKTNSQVEASGRTAPSLSLA
jgi:hypothetical protein